MNIELGPVRLRPLENSDVDALYLFKNDPEVANLLGGFSPGLSRLDVETWLSDHRSRGDEILWAIADAETDRCLGHGGLYQIDYRVRSAEFGIVIGDKALWGNGLGGQVTRAVLDYAFDVLNLNRVSLRVLATNERAISLYRRLNFKVEGQLEAAQFKSGMYVDMILMAILKKDRDSAQ